MKFSYSQRKQPPRPECFIRVRNPGTSDSFVDNIAAFIDSGADMTAIPRSIIENLGNLPQNYVTVQDVHGHHQRRTTYVVDIEIADNLLSKIEVVASSLEKVVIGRDILNQYKVVLNGPNNSWRLNCINSCDND